MTHSTDIDPSKVSASTAVQGRKKTLQERIDEFPWWVGGIFVIAIGAFYLVTTQSSFGEALAFIRIGIGITITTTLYAYGIALVLGLVAGLGRISRNVVIRNVATLYVELVRGIPILVLIFYIALVAVPDSLGLFKAVGDWLTSVGLGFIGGPLAGINNDSISLNVRAIIALSVTYGAFLAEIFRAGIESIGKGQMEAARSLGMSYAQAMRYVVLPQAIRNVLPALGNDFVAMVKDSSLVSMLAVRDITQVARLYAGRTFRFREAYTILAILYLGMTLVLSVLVRILEKRLHGNSRK
ncbi:MAG TPA: amino acid ABC transporter permease [Anaerolineales bacterium]|nr:amino acid ABC transporter permease [Anaerolineales bacterium]HRQ91737.1 amino acid ABC transporter permease [Anaerolineales bacterium]